MITRRIFASMEKKRADRVDRFVGIVVALIATGVWTAEITAVVVERRVRAERPVCDPAHGVEGLVNQTFHADGSLTCRYATTYRGTVREVAKRAKARL